MPLYFSEFTDLPLQFTYFEPCHYKFTSLPNIPLRTPSTCFFEFVDQNTPDLLLPLIPSLSFLSLHGRMCRRHPRPRARAPRRPADAAAAVRRLLPDPAAGVQSSSAWDIRRGKAVRQRHTIILGWRRGRARPGVVRSEAAMLLRQRNQADRLPVLRNRRNYQSIS